MDFTTSISELEKAYIAGWKRALDWFSVYDKTSPAPEDDCALGIYARGYAKEHANTKAEYERMAMYEWGCLFQKGTDPYVLKSCSDCGRDLRGYIGPMCRYCDGTAE